VQYVALIYGDATRWENLGEDARKQVYARYSAFTEEAREAGKLSDGAELAPTSAATTVRVRDEELLVTDGPFVETKEALGGYFVLECETLDEAVALAAKIPGAEHGAVEVRPVHVENGR
jgi:hypothetical protein